MEGKHPPVWQINLSTENIYKTIMQTISPAMAAHRVNSNERLS
jgi:hypothetical protein